MHFKINGWPQLNNTLQGSTVIFQVKDDVALPQLDKPAGREWHVRRAWGQLSAHVGSGTYSCTFTNVADTDSPSYGGAHAWQSKPAQFQLSNAMGSSKTRAACNVGHSHVTLPRDSLLLTLCILSFHCGLIIYCHVVTADFRETKLSHVIVSITFFSIF